MFAKGVGVDQQENQRKAPDLQIQSRPQKSAESERFQMRVPAIPFNAAEDEIAFPLRQESPRRLRGFVREVDKAEVPSNANKTSDLFSINT
jgi:hypothetical protein